MKAHDLRKREFGQLRVMRKHVMSAKSSSVRTGWLCECSCGGHIVCRASELVNGARTSCTQCKRKNLKDQVFDALTVIGEAPRQKGKHRYWLCRCVCGAEVVTDTPRLTGGRKTSCGCQTVRKPPKRRLPPGLALWRRHFSDYRRNARVKQIAFEIDFDTFRKICESRCYYCGTPPCRLMRRKGFPDEIYVNGIDRLNNACGYISDNIVPCCFVCNYRKGDTHVHDFLRWIAQIAKHRRLRDFSQGKVDLGAVS